MRYRISAALFEKTFEHFRQCGRGRRECQVLWTSSWDDPENISEAVHPLHLANGGGFQLSSDWINQFWCDLARTNCGIHVQIHTHPREAFHSYIDDQFPTIHTAGFLSLVIPDFGLGAIGLDHAYLTEIDERGNWRECTPQSRLEIIP